MQNWSCRPPRLVRRFRLQCGARPRPMVAQSGTAATADCAGGDATVNGSGDTITFRNSCRTLTVNGTGNRVSYTPVGGTQDAAVTYHGQGNTVEHLAALPNGTAAIIAGPSPGVSVRGTNGETVQIGPNGVVAVPAPGTGGAVTITPGGIAVAPGVTTTAPTVATGPGQLMLSGDRQNRDASCSGATVYISGDNGKFTLRGGCKALFIRGDHNIAHVELMPGAQIAIQGDNLGLFPADGSRAKSDAARQRRKQPGLSGAAHRRHHRHGSPRQCP